MLHRWVPSRMMWRHAPFCRKLIVLPGACICSLVTYFNLLSINHLYVLFVEISYQARLCLQISYPAISVTMLIGFLKSWEFSLFMPFCREQAKHSHCQFFCWAHRFTSFCRAHGGVLMSCWHHMISHVGPCHTYLSYQDITSMLIMLLQGFPPHLSEFDR